MINIQNIDDNESFKWCLIRYLNPADHHPARISKDDKDFAERLDFKDLNIPVKIREMHKKVKKDSIGISVFGYEYKENIKFMYQKTLWRKPSWFFVNRKKKQKTSCSYQKF